MTALVIDIAVYRARLERAGVRPVAGLSPFWPAASGLWLLWAMAWNWPLMVVKRGTDA